MKKALKLKAFMLSLIMTALLLPMTSFAQQTSDDFFCVDDAFNGNRDVVAWNITNNGIGQSEAPVGSGLLILGAIGAGYAIAKRKRNKKGAALLLALALTLGFTQCKKKVVEPIANNGNTVHITLTMADGGSKVDVNPTGSGTYATVAFEKDDIIYVGNGNKYVGYVTYNGTDTWEGDLTSPTTDDYLHLYFLGNKAPLSDVTPGTTTEFSVSIADQASKYPVISYNHTLEKYNGEGSYTATTLYNKCSIMKFNVTTLSTAAVCITGMNNKVTVNFANPTVDDNGFSYSVNTTDGGLIKMPAKDASNITWAIVLPQEALAEGAEGSAYTNGYIGNRPAISKIERNHYYAGDGIAITVNKESKIKDLSTLTENWTAEDGWTLTGTLAVNKKISIAAGATVTLNDATINNGTNDESYKWAGITCLGNATIILSGTNTVKGFYEDYPGIQAAHNTGSGDEYTLTIQGTGSLTASSNGHGAGIGGGYRLACGNIEIQGGVITATSNNSVAGIGSGFQGSCGNITISGGNITANGGGNNAAGIGTGAQGTCGNITISGGSITANGGGTGAGIGTGAAGTCLNITINNTVTSVTATKGTGAPNSIGAGDYGTCGTVTIGGVVYWNGSSYQNGGDTYLPTSPLVYPTPAPSVTDLATITENYTASDGEILTGTLGANVKISIADGATVTLDGVSINASGTWTTGNYAGITCVGDATIILSGTNNVKGFYEDYPGIYVPENKTVTIQGSGSLTASSNGYGAGIGGGWEINCGNIEIQGGTITATGDTGCAGIGAGNGGYNGASCGNITISGGTVTAIGSQAAGIGSGYGQSADSPSTCGAISISGGTVRATAGALAPAAIGKGAVDHGESTCASVTITPGITSLTLTNSVGDGIVSDFIDATAVYANTTPITSMLSTYVGAITGEMATAGFATSYDEGTKTWTITKKE